MSIMTIIQLVILVIGLAGVIYTIFEFTDISYRIEDAWDKFYLNHFAKEVTEEEYKRMCRK